MANKDAKTTDPTTAPLLPVGLDQDVDGLADPRAAELNDSLGVTKLKPSKTLTAEEKVDAMMAVDPANSSDPSGSAEDPTTPTTEPELSEPPKTTQTSPSDDVQVDPLAIDTPQTDAAIDDIVAQEADQVLAAEDAGIKLANDAAEADVSELAEPHGHPVFWFIVVLLVVLALVFAYVLLQPGLSLPFSD
jgi:hypothetical protein